MNIVKGFTLIEVMVAVLIIAILAAIAYPSYQGTVRKARRADAQAVMLQLTQWMERFYTVNHRYDRVYAIPPAEGALVTTLIPSNLTKSPSTGSPTYYNIQPVNITATAFTINAAPIGSQQKDECGTLTLTNTGVRGVTGATQPVDRCWPQ